MELAGRATPALDYTPDPDGDIGAIQDEIEQILGGQKLSKRDIVAMRKLIGAPQIDQSTRETMPTNTTPTPREVFEPNDYSRDTAVDDAYLNHLLGLTEEATKYAPGHYDFTDTADYANPSQFESNRGEYVIPASSQAGVESQVTAEAQYDVASIADIERAVQHNEYPPYINDALAYTQQITSVRFRGVQRTLETSGQQGVQ